MDVIIKRNDRLTAGPCSKTTGEEVRSRSVVRLEKQTRCLSTRRVAHILNKRELFQVKSSQVNPSQVKSSKLPSFIYGRLRSIPDFRFQALDQRTECLRAAALVGTCLVDIRVGWRFPSPLPSLSLLRKDLLHRIGVLETGIRSVDTEPIIFTLKHSSEPTICRVHLEVLTNNIRTVGLLALPCSLEGLVLVLVCSYQTSHIEFFLSFLFCFSMNTS